MNKSPYCTDQAISLVLSYRQGKASAKRPVQHAVFGVRITMLCLHMCNLTNIVCCGWSLVIIYDEVARPLIRLNSNQNVRE